MSNLVSVPELASFLGLSRTLCHYYLKTLDVPIQTVGRGLFVSEDQVAGIVQQVADYRNRKEKK